MHLFTELLCRHLKNFNLLAFVLFQTERLSFICKQKLLTAQHTTHSCKQLLIKKKSADVNYSSQTLFFLIHKQILITKMIHGTPRNHVYARNRKRFAMRKKNKRLAFLRVWSSYGLINLFASVCLLKWSHSVPPTWVI